MSIETRGFTGWFFLFLTGAIVLLLIAIVLTALGIAPSDLSARTECDATQSLVENLAESTGTNVEDYRHIDEPAFAQEKIFYYKEDSEQAYFKAIVFQCRIDKKDDEV